ncbi:hypothetical protein GUJ93_ZPchr0007g4079 [Zizania palustris]|uniref:Uncharacterized protein n=1 Tax=Zizania palustris TaxID=103762 RepID=A0A8J5SSR0_ZIZPA|nr:hypothetical protein GUJ93_ZPchr0007g4079 [Zizania palustris]
MVERRRIWVHRSWKRVVRGGAGVVRGAERGREPCHQLRASGWMPGYGSRPLQEEGTASVAPEEKGTAAGREGGRTAPAASGERRAARF